MFDQRFNSTGAKSPGGVPELINKKWLNFNLTCGTNFKIRLMNN